tara:strand:+ start:736 stop:1317 length:582 start_codon:yes stop_codon:yes gene_type:complete
VHGRLTGLAFDADGAAGSGSAGHVRGSVLDACEGLADRAPDPVEGLGWDLAHFAATSGEALGPEDLVPFDAGQEPFAGVADADRELEEVVAGDGGIRLALNSFDGVGESAQGFEGDQGSSEDDRSGGGGRSESPPPSARCSVAGGALGCLSLAGAFLNQKQRGRPSRIGREALDDLDREDYSPVTVPVIENSG